LSLLLVLIPAIQRFFLGGSLVIIPPQKPTPLNFNLIWKQKIKSLFVECAKATSLFIDCLIYLLPKKKLVLLTAEFPLIISFVIVSKKNS